MRLPIALIRSPAEQSAFGGVIRTKARSFAFAARFLDPPRRYATEVLYAFFRTVDDLVDERPPHADPAPVWEALDRWERWLACPAPAGPDSLETALYHVLGGYRIPAGYLLALIEGQRDDLRERPIDSFPDLERYAFRVAASVGLAMCHVLGGTGHRAFAGAAALGIAMQLTNILRDLREDLARGRVYLPADELEQFGYRGRTLMTASPGKRFGALLAFQIARTRRYYAAGMAGIDELDTDVRFPIAVAALLYSRILSKIEQGRYDVFARRAAVGRAEKVALAASLAVRGGLGGLDTDRAEPLEVLGPAARAELAACGAPGFARA
jgi:phytoene synthase